MQIASVFDSRASLSRTVQVLLCPELLVWPSVVARDHSSSFSVRVVESAPAPALEYLRETPCSTQLSRTCSLNVPLDMSQRQGYLNTKYMLKCQYVKAHNLHVPLLKKCFPGQRGFVHFKRIVCTLLLDLGWCQPQASG